MNARASQNAATLAAADESLSKPSLRGAAASQAPSIVAAAPQPVERPARFTTVEEEEALRRVQQKRSWLLVAAQLAAFAAVVATMGGAIVFLSRPPSADKLYAAISTRIDSGDDASLTNVENEVNSFLARFPEDPRAVLLRGYRERIELDKLERKLQRQTRGSGSVNRSLLPAEQLYLEAAGLAAASPEKSLAMLGALVDLYGADVPVAPKIASPGTTNRKNADRDAADRTADVVQLAKRRLPTLRADLAKQREQQLTALNERLAAAERLRATNPQQAAAIYRAILSLYEGDAWAAPVVDKARGALAELEKK